MPVDPGLTPAPLGAEGAFQAQNMADLERRVRQLENARGVSVQQFQVGYTTGLVSYGCSLTVRGGRLWLIAECVMFPSGTPAANTQLGFNIVTQSGFSGQAYVYANGTVSNPQMRTVVYNPYALPGVALFQPQSPTGITSGNATGVLIEVPWDA